MFYKFNNYQLPGCNLYRCVVLALTLTPCISQAHTGLADVSEPAQESCELNHQLQSS